MAVALTVAVALVSKLPFSSPSAKEEEEEEEEEEGEEEEKKKRKGEQVDLTVTIDCT